MGIFDSMIGMEESAGLQRSPLVILSEMRETSADPNSAYRPMPKSKIGTASAARLRGLKGFGKKKRTNVPVQTEDEDL